MISEVLNIDCNEYMKTLPNKFFDLAIVDVNYGLGMSVETSAASFKSKKWQSAKPKGYIAKNWDNNGSPDKYYFDELFRISENQIICGANHFISKIPYDSSCWIVWDKVNGENSFADCELAWTSFKTAVRKFEYLWNGFQKAKPESRIHPTQKPVALYTWLLQNYAKPGDKIFDSHMGSQSSRIAAYKLGFDYWGCELDKDYFKTGCERFEKEIAMPLFDNVKEKFSEQKLF